MCAKVQKRKKVISVIIHHLKLLLSIKCVKPRWTKLKGLSTAVNHINSSKGASGISMQLARCNLP